MNVVINESYEAAAAEWQYQMILILKNTLNKYGVNEDVAKDICGDFTFDLAMLQDQGEIKVDGEKLRPVICFDNFNDELKYNSSDDFSLHDYAFGNSNEAFGE